MVTVLRLLLRGEDPAAITAALGPEAARIWETISGEPGARVRVLELQPGVAARTPHADYMRGTPFEAALEIGIEGAPLARMLGVAEGVGGRLGDVIDADGSYALLGPEYVFSPGETDVVLFVAIGRRLEQSYEDLHRHWLNRHGWLVKPGADASGSGYRQFHADPKASSLAARASGLGRHELEGCAVGFYPSVDFYLEGMNRREALAHIYEDERNFIDPETSSPGLYWTVGRHDAC